MRALLLCAGMGRRLGNLSQTTPKCLLSVGGEPLFDRLVTQLTETGVDEILVNTHHLASVITQHIAKRSDRDRFTITYEAVLMGTLGTLRANTGFFKGGPGWVLHADNYIQGSLVPMLRAFESRPRSTWGTMLTFAVEESHPFGVVELDQAGTAVAFHEKLLNAPSRIASAATFLFDERVMKLAEQLPSGANDISTHLLPHLMGSLMAVNSVGHVIDIGTPKGLAAARTMALQSS